MFKFCLNQKCVFSINNLVDVKLTDNNQTWIQIKGISKFKYKLSQLNTLRMVWSQNNLDRRKTSVKLPH